MDMYEVNAKVTRRLIYRVYASGYADAAEKVRELIDDNECLDDTDDVTIGSVIKLDGTEDDG